MFLYSHKYHKKFMHMNFPNGMTVFWVLNFPLPDFTMTLTNIIFLLEPSFWTNLNHYVGFGQLLIVLCMSEENDGAVL